MLVAGDTGSGSIIFASETFAINGTTDEIETAFEGTNTIRVGLVDNPVVSGNFTANGSISDNTLSIQDGNITSAVNITATGTVDAGTVEFNNLSGTGSVTITDILDEDNLASDSATALATQQSIKAYVDAEFAAGGLAMNFAGDTGSGSIVFSSETYNVFGTANQITTTADGLATITLSLPDDLIAPSNLSVTNNLTTSLTAGRVPFITTGGLLTDDAGLTYTSGSGTLNATIAQFGTLTDGVLSITSIKDEDDMVSDLANAIPTQQSVKAYVDTEIAKYDVLTVNGDGGTGTVDLNAQALNIIGTTNEIETNMNNQTLQIGLPNDVTINGNATISGSLLSDDITAAAISIAGDATVTGNLTVQGSTTIVDSTTVQIADATFRVNSDGAVVSAGLEANIAGVIESVLYVPGSSRWELSGNVYTAEDLTVGGTGDFGGVEFDSLSGTGAVSVTDILDQDDMSSDSATALATQQSIKAYVDSTVGTSESSANLDVAADTGSGTIFIASEQFRVLGGTNINTSVDQAGGNVITVNLDDSVSTGNVTVTSTLQFGTLSDGTDSITNFETVSDGVTNSESAVPTSAAVIDYVANNGGDGLVLRGTFTADSTNDDFSVGTTPNVTARTYYATKVTVNIGTAFSGGSVNQIKISDNAALVIADVGDTDIANTGTYIIEQDGTSALAKNSPITVEFLQSDGTTPAIPTAGVITVMVEYAYTV
jgi:hypothetical protein